MTPRSYILSDKDFWKWMQPTETDGVFHTSSHHESYLKMLAKMMAPPDYIAHFGEIRGRSNNAKTIAMLIERVPRWYFLELQYCMAAYARVFGTLFPSMLGDIGELAFIEWLHYVKPEHPQYRDHLVHMFKVAYAGTKLLSIDEMIERATVDQFASPHFSRWCRKMNVRTEDWDQQYRREITKVALYLAAIFHDIGYGYYYLNKYRDRLSGVCRWVLPEADPSSIEHRDTKTVLKSLTSEFIEEYNPQCWLHKSDRDVIIAGFYKDCLRLNHSVASSFFIVDLAEQLYLRDALKPELYLAFQIAAEAVMLHDMVKDGTWLHLKAMDNGYFLCCEEHHNVPLAPILVLADELAGWGRATLSHRLEGKKHVKATMKPDNGNVVKMQVIDGNDPSIQVRFKHPEQIPDIKNLKCFSSATKCRSVMKLLGFKLEMG